MTATFAVNPTASSVAQMSESPGVEADADTGLEFEAPPDDVAEISPWDATEDAETNDAGEPVVEEAAPAIHKEVLKVNGKDIELTLDEMKSAARQFLASEQKLEQAKQTAVEVKKQLDAVNHFVSVLQKGDTQTISRMFKQAGMDFDKLAMDRALEMIAWDTMPEGDREKIELQRKVETYERQHHQAQQADLQRRQEAASQFVGSQLMQSIPFAITEVGLPQTEGVVSQMAEVWHAAIEAGHLPAVPASGAEYAAHAKMVAMYVADLRKQTNATELSALSVDDLIQILGPKADEIAKKKQKPAPKPVAKRENLRKSAKEEGFKYVPASKWGAAA